jgi:uncharacterized protein DUF4145
MFGDMFKSKPRPKGQRGETLPEGNDGPPDSSRPQGLCSRCNKQSSFHVLGSLPVTFGSTYTVERDGSRTPSAVEQVSALRCRNCGHCVVVVEEQWVGETPWHQGLGKGGVLTWRGVHWWPLPDTKLPADVPVPIAAVFAEAAKTLAAGCPRATAVMVRRTLEAITADKGQTKGTLAQQLAALGAAGTLPPAVAEWATEVRLVGNAGAHFDPMDEVTQEDAHQVLSFTREVLKHLYELPAELARRRASRAP